MDTKFLQSRIDTLIGMIDDERKFLVIMWDTWVWKTYAVKQVVQHIQNRDKRIYMIDDPTRKAHLSSQNLKLRAPEDWGTPYSYYPLEAMARYDYAVFDDFWSSWVTEAYIEKMLYWINARMEKWLKTIITTNLSKEKFDKFEARIVSRISENALFITFTWDDLRKKTTQFISL